MSARGSPARSGRAAIGACVLAAIVASGGACEGEPETTTVQRDTSGAGLGHLKALAFREMREQSERTCYAVPRAVLARAFLRLSDAPAFGRDPVAYVRGPTADNNLGLLYAEDIDMNPIRLQSAAYMGCIVGLETRARERRGARR